MLRPRVSNQMRHIQGLVKKPERFDPAKQNPQLLEMLTKYEFNLLKSITKKFTDQLRPKGFRLSYLDIIGYFISFESNFEKRLDQILIIKNQSY